MQQQYGGNTYYIMWINNHKCPIIVKEVNSVKVSRIQLKVFHN